MRVTIDVDSRMVLCMMTDDFSIQEIWNYVGRVLDGVGLNRHVRVLIEGDHTLELNGVKQ